MRLLHSKKLWLGIILASVWNTRNFEAAGTETKNNNIWLKVGKMAGFLLQKCLPPSFQDQGHPMRDDSPGLILQECLKRRGLLAIDRALRRDVIQISDGVVLAKWKNDSEVIDRSHNPQLERAKSIKEFTNWQSEFLKKIFLFLRTRVLKVRLNGFNFTSEFEGRHRRKNNMMGQLMMFGLVAAGLIVIPLGFQFLAVLGGKALLLAKLALLLTSIQGLKKIATSQMNYGLYSTGQGPWQYDRQWPYELETYPSNSHSSVDTTSDLLHPVHTNFHPRQEDLYSSY